MSFPWSIWHTRCYRKGMAGFTDIGIGRESGVVQGHFGDPVRVSEALFSRGRGMNSPRRPLFVLLHGWGSNEEDIAGFFGSYVSPFSDYVSLRAPLALAGPQDAGADGGPGAYTWFHDPVPHGDDLDRDIYQAARAVDRWIEESVPQERDIVLFGFSQGGALAVHMLRMRPERYKGAVCLSGFLAPAAVPGVAPADARLAQIAPPVFYGYGLRDDMSARFESSALAAFLEEKTFLKLCEYAPLDHAVSLDECNDIRQWLMDLGASSGVM